MFEEKENEVVEAETNEVEAKEEAKAEQKESNGASKYHLIKENFNKALTFAIIICAIDLVHGILAACGVSGNLPWLIINCVCVAGLVVFGIFSLLLFIRKTNPKRNEDLASFIISLVAFILAFLFALWFFGDAIRNLIGFFKEL